MRQGEFVSAGGTTDQTHARLLNTIGTAAGLRGQDGEAIADFGDPILPRAPLDVLLA